MASLGEPIHNRKYHSESTKKTLVSNGPKFLPARDRFEKKVTSTVTKQDSFDIPDDPEDNVFKDCEKERIEEAGPHVRSFSLPARLPDLVPETSSSSNESPDFLDGLQEKEKFPQTAIKFLPNEHEKKRIFEGKVCYDQYDDTLRRKKSVSFQSNPTGENEPKKESETMSTRGQQARSHFRSSGYGSLSSSQASHGSKSSVVSEQDSFIVDDHIGTDGSIYNSSEREEDCRDVRGSKSTSFTLNEPNEVESESTKLQTYGIPRLSIFNSDTETLTHTYSLGDEKLVLGNNTPLNGDSELQQEKDFLTEQVPVGTYLAERDEVVQMNCDEWPINKYSPKTNEECQKELLLRLFNDRMVQFNPDKETLPELLEWLKSNIADLMTPSPKSPFFSPTASPLRLPQALANALGISTNTTGESQTDIAEVCMESGKEVSLISNGLSARIVTSMASVQIEPAANSIPVSSYTSFQVTQSSMVSREPAPSSIPALSEIICQKAKLPTVPKVVEECDDLDSQSICLTNVGSMVSGVPSSYNEKLSQCNESICDDRECREIKKRISSFKNALSSGSELSDENVQFLNILHNHYMNCDMPNCRAPWCRLVGKGWQDDIQGTQDILTVILNNPMHTLLPPGATFSKFLKLDASLPWDHLPKEGEDWIVLNPLSSSHSVVRATILNPIWSPKHWTVKLTSLHESENQLCMFNKLKDLRHDNIVRHLWAAADCDNLHLLVGTEYFTGISLKEVLRRKLRLTASKAREYLLHMLCAIDHLHSLNILYLNWSSSNLMLDYNAQKIKLTNFTSSVFLSEQLIDDIGDVKLSLPVDVVPPELMIGENRLSYKSDSWGIACVLYEMLTGMRPWQDFSHLSPQRAWKEILQTIPPHLASNIPGVARCILDGCIVESPDNRLPVKDIRKFALAWQ